MKTQIVDINQAHLSPKKLVLSLGGFDGVHLGHQALINRLISTAKEKKSSSCLCIFDPLPFQVLKGQSSFKRLFTIEETQEILYSFGLDFLCVIPFDHQFSRLEPEEFIQSFIVRHFDPVHIIVGYDFAFAYQKKGDFSILKKIAEPLAFSVESFPAHLYDGGPVSSSRIRNHLSLAQMDKVKDLLGRPFSIQSSVIQGEARGRKLGFRTANLKVQKKELPPFGVYGGRAKIADSWYKAVINIGQRPTFFSNDYKSKPPVLVEVHIISSKFDLYNEDLKIELDFFIREEKAFSNVLDLQTAIQEDIQQVLAFR